MSLNTAFLKATYDRLGDTGYTDPEYVDTRYVDLPYHQQQHQLEQEQQQQQHHVSEVENQYPQYTTALGGDSGSPTTGPWIPGHYERDDFGMASLFIHNGEGSVDHSSPIQGFPSSPNNLPLAWVPYEDNEFSRNFEYTYADTIQRNNYYHSSPRVLGDNIPNPGYPSLFPSDELSQNTICGTTSSNHSNHDGVTEENENKTLEIPSDQNNNNNADTRNTLASGSAPSRFHKCRTCGIQFRRRAEVDRHRDSVHQSSAPGHLCPIQGCNRSVKEKGFSRKDNLRQHLKLKHDMKFPKGRRCRNT